MAPQHSALIPRRLVLTIDIPEWLSDSLIDEQVSIAASRLRFALSKHYQAQAYERVNARVLGRREARRARRNAP
jgi:hypothetical protein